MREELKQYQKRINELTGEIKKHNQAYYEADAPLISDFQYDALMRELISLEAQYPQFAAADSPTQRVGGKALASFSQIEHAAPLLSLDNAFNPQDMLAFFKRVKKTLGAETPLYVTEQKMDGLSVAIQYRDGKLEFAATRGDGLVGENITANISTIKSLPQRLKKKLPFLAVRGEVYMPKEAFRILNEEREEAGESPFANPRNAAAGSLRQLDEKITAGRRLELYVYEIIAIEGYELKSHDLALKTLKEWGFPVNPDYLLTDNEEGILDYIKLWQDKRHNLPYETDGMVIKIDAYNYRDSLGATSKFPRWAMAYKFPPEEAVTQIKDIIIGVGRTGAMTPLALLEPVKIAGSVVSRATLHNEDNIKDKDIRIGDYVIVHKAGDIIPEIVLPKKGKRTGEEKLFIMPEFCPECNTRAIRREGEAAWRCPNLYCPARIRESIIHFVSKKMMDIDGFGPAVLQQLLERELIKDVSDIYFLKEEQLISLDRMGEKSARNLIEAIEKSKKQPLHRLLYGLGIRFVGERAAKILAENYSDIYGIINASLESLLTIPEIGNKIAISIREYFSNEENLKRIEILANAGLNMAGGAKNSNDGPLKGKTLVITGTLLNMDREKAKEIIENAGGRVSSSVSKKTDYLLMGENPGSKEEKAKEAGVKIISLEDLKDLIRGE